MSEPAVLPAAQALSAAQKLKQREDAIRANAIKQGREAERKDQEIARAEAAAKHAGELAGVKQAHEQELDRAARLIGKAAHRDGMVQGTMLGAILVAALAIGSFAIIRETVILNTATQRVNYPRPPALVDQYEEPAYERGAREPPSAGTNSN